MQILSPAAKHLKGLLAAKYHYSESNLGGRIKETDLGGNIGGAILLEAFETAPFLLAIACDGPPSKAIRREAEDFILENQTLGTLVFFDAESKELEVCKRRFRDAGFEKVPELEYYFRNRPSLFDADQSKKPHLFPLTNKLEEIFFDAHSAMRDIDGVHADAALEELCKLLYLKSYVEEQSERLPISAVHSSSFGTNEEFAAALRALYFDANQYDLRVFRLKIPEYERSRGVFGVPFCLSSAALTKSFQLIENYTLNGSKADVKGRAFQKVLTRAVRSGMGQYFTPAPVCELMVKVTNPTSSDLIIDPFCGSGHFLSESLDYVGRGLDRGSKEYHEFAFGKLHGIEKSDRMTRVAMTDMRLHGDGHSNIRCTDALLDFRNYPDLAPASFDIVLTNPPFGSLLGEEAFASLARFDLAQGRKRAPLEILGLERSIEFLRPGGKLGIVLPESIFSAKSCDYIREWLADKVRIRAIVDLPAETFSPYGANVRSGVLFASKWRPGEKRSTDHSVCMIKLENLGYDASGRDKLGSEVDEVSDVLLKFFQENDW